MTIPTITVFSSSLWTAIEAPLANHLWQSTLFAAVAGVLTLALKKNRAQVRYWLWLSASVKFLVPFSLLVSAGSYLGWSKTSAPSGFSFVIEEISQPFSVASSHAAASTALEKLIGLLPTLLLIAWICGYVAVLIFWWVRWRCITASIHGASPTKPGRELEALRRLEQSAGIKKQIKLIVSESALEPGIVGIFRPILLLPAGISDRLSDAQMRAIITHELCHVRRRDNLTAAVHMLAEAIFWFHPLVWWIGARLVDERERVCDEEVLAQGSDPQVYAEGILRVCEFYLESPLVCAAGVTGSNLKKRIEAIMFHRVASKLNLVKKLLLTAAAAATLGLPVVFGVLHPASGYAQSQPATAPVFQDVSLKPAGVIKPGDVIRTRMTEQNGVLDAKNITLEHLIHFAYGVSESQMAGAPDWIASDLYDLNVKTNEAVNSDRFKLAVQDLLFQKFKLTVHHELKDAPTYALVVGPNGSKLAAADIKDKPGHFMVQPAGHLEANGAKIKELANFLQDFTGRMVIDKTGLNGTYDFTLNEGLAAGSAKGPDRIAALQKAVSEQLGLELTPQVSPVDMLVIDHVERVTNQQ
ncbi:MAG TPA: M56 family metallopeptidase [Candidatus Angelobacter sp.]|nr:M56 family metallopeptidase [Candidatus Angelobacter sp.]